MKFNKIGMLVASAALALATATVGAQGGTAYGTAFETSVTYQNIDASTPATGATVNFVFYPEGSGTGIRITRPNLARDAGTSLRVGSLSEPALAGFKGSAVLESDRRIGATAVQLPNSASAVKNRPLSNGFSAEEGAPQYLIATVLKNKFNSTTQFSVQNVSAAAVNVTIRFFSAEGATQGQEIVAARQTISGLPVNAAKYFDAGQIAGLGSVFNGSAEITATGGNIVASALELSTNSIGASAFEGVTGGATTVYMASAICNAFGTGANAQNTSYAIQNTSATQTANVTVTFSNGQALSRTIAPLSKASVQGCEVNPAGFSGSATIVSTGAPIVAIGKVSGAGITSAFLGATRGAARLALPYVRWTTSQFVNNGRQRTFLAIQNIGAPIAAGQAITVRYVGKDGELVGTHTIPGPIATGQKVNSNPSNIGAAGNEFGYYTNGQFGGSAIVEGPAGSQLVAVARVQSKTTSSSVAEDYNGIDATAR